MSEAYVFRGDFRVLKMDGMFHVVFRPDAHPEWFRTIASFFTYERAYQYCDVERVLSFDNDSGTTEEMAQGREPPPLELVDRQADFGVAEIVRDIVQNQVPDEQPADLPSIPLAAVDEVVDQQPGTHEGPEAYAARMAQLREDIASAADEASKPISVSAVRQNDTDLPPLTDKQASVLGTLKDGANYLGLVSISLSRLAREAKVPNGSISFIVESLERRKLVVKKESGTSSGSSSLFQVLNA